MKLKNYYIILNAYKDSRGRYKHFIVRAATAVAASSIHNNLNKNKRGFLYCYGEDEVCKMIYPYEYSENK